MTTTEIEQILDASEVIYTMDMDELIARLNVYVQRWE